jgi:hypothetical protein
MAYGILPGAQIGLMKSQSAGWALLRSSDMAGFELRMTMKLLIYNGYELRMTGWPQ